MKSRTHYRNARRNTPEALRRRSALQDARREAWAATLPPIEADPAPLSLWQTITVELYVPTLGRCDQFAAVVNGERVGLLGATEIGRAVARRVSKRPSYAIRAEMRDTLEMT
jgi:lactate dehydrogenase-like 2-hydroxyacid dehydrogenase